MTSDTTKKPARDKEPAFPRGQRVKLIANSRIRGPALPPRTDWPKWPPYGAVSPIAIGRVVSAPHPAYPPGVWVDFECDPVHVPRWFDPVDALRCLVPHDG